GETIAGGSFTFDGEIEKIASGGTLGKGAASIREIAKNSFDFDAEVLNRPEVGTENFDAKLGAEASGEHFSAGLNGHPENVGHAGRFDFLIHLGEQLFPG